jgi:hypothetical protein
VSNEPNHSIMSLWRVDVKIREDGPFIFDCAGCCSQEHAILCLVHVHISRIREQSVNLCSIVSFIPQTRHSPVSWSLILCNLSLVGTMSCTIMYQIVRIENGNSNP